jgi:hypothetical protein
MMCKPCAAHYLLEGKSRLEDYWAAMIWKFIFPKTIHDDYIERILIDKW